MGKQLIIAEKKSLASKIVEAIQINDSTQRFSNRGRHFESQGFYVVYGRGHLLELIDLEEYKPDYDPSKRYYWNLEELPFVPKTFRFRPSTTFEEKTVKGQKKKVRVEDKYVRALLDNIVDLYKQGDISSVVNAGDSGREGTLIGYLINWHAVKESKKEYPVYRLWSNDQTPPTLAKALNSMKPINEYKNDIQEGFARLFLDWVDGINLTRYTSIKAGTTVVVGRVVTAMTMAIHDRCVERENFVPTKYWQAHTDASVKGYTIPLTSKIKHETLAACQQLSDEYNGLPAVVSSAVTKPVVVNAPLLFSTTTLQNEASKRFGLSPKETSKAAETLYQNGYLTYPRTAAEYLFTTEAATVQELLDAHGSKVTMKSGSRVFNDKAIKDEDHSALLPLQPTSHGLTGVEKDVFEMVLNRFHAVFSSEDCVVDRSTIQIDVGNKESFTITGDKTVTAGWRKYEPNTKADKEIPSLTVGDTVACDFSPAEKETNPPALFTVTTFNNYLINPFKKKSAIDEEDDDSSVDANGYVIGTDATRGDTIDKAIRLGYIELKSKKYSVTPHGRKVVKAIRDLDVPISPDKTAEMGGHLRRVKRGEETVKNLLYEETLLLIDVIKNGKDIEKIADNTSARKGYVKTPYGERKVLGKCTFCKKQIINSPKTMSCVGCGATVWKENKMFQSMGVDKLTDLNCLDFLTKGKSLVTGLKSKNTGKEYDATFSMSYSKGSKFVEFKMQINPKKS